VTGKYWQQNGWQQNGQSKYSAARHSVANLPGLLVLFGQSGDLDAALIKVDPLDGLESAVTQQDIEVPAVAA
jgi:hypothetical protein